MADQSSRNTTPACDRTYPDGYGVVEPVANYRPWDVDADFQALYGDIREHTMVDIYRLWILWVLARRAPPGAVLEVGSWRGGSGAVLAGGRNRTPGRRTEAAPCLPRRHLCRGSESRRARWLLPRRRAREHEPRARSFAPGSAGSRVGRASRGHLSRRHRLESRG